MFEFYQFIALVLLLTMALSLWRLIWAPSRSDRMLAAQLLGSSGVAILLVLAQAYEFSALRDVALVFALLAAVSGMAFARVSKRGDA